MASRFISSRMVYVHTAEGASTLRYDIFYDSGSDKMPWYLTENNNPIAKASNSDVLYNSVEQMMAKVIESDQLSAASEWVNWDDTYKETDSAMMDSDQSLYTQQVSLDSDSTKLLDLVKDDE